MPLPQINRRQFTNGLLAASAAGFYTSSAAKNAFSAPNESIGLGYIGCGGRSNNLMREFKAAGGTHVAAVCDADQDRTEAAGEKFPKAKQYQDLRKLIADPAVDAVVISTCNHWHCLAAIWSMEAGKHVYVEKPLSHTQWEGEQVVAAARKYDRICQLGTQQRSDPMQAMVRAFLHDEQGLGEIESVRVNRIGIRRPIGKRSKPLAIGKSVNYDLWLGPAVDEPIYRNNLHYDWHWDWNTGSGEMGNWGVHIVDDVRNTVFQDKVDVPRRVFGCGGRVGYNDAGQTPNIHLVQLDTGSIPLTIALSNLPAKPGAKSSHEHIGPPSGYVVKCSGGTYYGQRSRGQAVDNDGKVIREFRGNGNVVHEKNFVEAVQSGNRSELNAEIAIGNDSTAWCNLANVVAQVGQPFDQDLAKNSGSDVYADAVTEFEQHLSAYGKSINDDGIRGCDWLTFDAKTRQFTGRDGEVANQFLKRAYRPGYEVPTLA